MGDGWEYLCKSCGLAAEWSQQDSCSGLLSLNHDMCYHSRHCSLHRSLQGNTHSVRQTPQKIQSRFSCDLLISSNWNSIHEYWYNCKNYKKHHYIHHYFCEQAKSSMLIKCWVVERKKESKDRNSNECSQWKRLPVRETKSLSIMKGDKSLGNIANTAKHGNLNNFTCCVCMCIKGMWARLFLFGKSKLWPPKILLYCRKCLLSIIKGEFSFADASGWNHQFLPGFDKTFQAFWG